MNEEFWEKIHQEAVKFRNKKRSQKMFKRMKTGVDNLKKGLMAMIAPFKWIIEGAKKVAKFLGFGGDEAEESEKKTKKLKEEA